jgi:hypothetical protein
MKLKRLWSVYLAVLVTLAAAAGLVLKHFRHRDAHRASRSQIDDRVHQARADSVREELLRAKTHMDSVVDSMAGAGAEKQKVHPLAGA